MHHLSQGRNYNIWHLPDLQVSWYKPWARNKALKIAMPSMGSPVIQISSHYLVSSSVLCIVFHSHLWNLAQILLLNKISINDFLSLFNIHHYNSCTSAGSIVQWCPTLQPHNCSPPGYSVLGISQERILTGVAISYSRGSSLPRDWTCNSGFSCTGRWIHYH